ncbi:hypothetical protein KsCSTR_43820 [Candidatus Kuenenia stuttgartiensis]|jgi:hypothetical protein|uniref:Uncharacterized protein n=1 Tax=Kuenenia stuttgartiensis TaxID=174633 RepID=Q1PX07_KUEST|nr:hypothetical protein KsCSTR_43820 [Candidatus Kuenenia stuttgartiensis]CAJ71756.1 unknown protein [Candidatus Kuenenia stuttgartiensis]SOH05116.1 hypothetical protein KSMBR1_2629 [Candidatus Kuenenia stuttgartiensis]
MSAYIITRQIGPSWGACAAFSLYLLCRQMLRPYYKKIAGAIKTIHGSANFGFSAV